MEVWKFGSLVRECEKMRFVNCRVLMEAWKFQKCMYEAWKYENGSVDCVLLVANTVHVMEEYIFDKKYCNKYFVLIIY